MTIGQRLEEAMKAAGFINQQTLAEASGLPQPTISRILKNTAKKSPSGNTIKLLADACGVSFQWLYEGTGPMARQSEGGLSGVIKVDTEDAVGNFVGIKMLKRQVFLGLDSTDADWEYEDEVTLSLPFEWLRQKRLSASDLFAFRATGQSMFPTIRDGALVVATRADTQPVDSKLFAVNHNGRPVVKRMEREAGTWYLASDNPAPEFRRRAVDNDSRIIGRILRVEMDID
jgi:phage repressor protein C with HTH and peptisase S24 domain